MAQIGKIKYLVVHCSDSPNDREVDAAEINRWHLERGWDGIGYHAVIQRSGLLEYGRPPYWQGAHVKGHNHESLGVCMIGDDVFTDAQFRTLRTLLQQWQRQHPKAQVVGHCDLDPHKTCPNFNVKPWWEGKL